MANVKITELTAYTNPASTDVVPIVDLVSDQTKKVTIADLLENAGAGSASAAAFAFDGDSDTGMYRPAANELGFTTGGTGRLFIDSAGKVGIGDTDLDGLLVIKGNSDASTTPSIRLKDDTDTREAWITNASGDLSLNVGGNDNVAHGTLKIFDSGILDFAQSAGSRLRIDSSGRVLIGDSTSFAIAEADDLQIGSTSSASHGLTVKSSTGGYLFFADSADADVAGFVYSHADDSLRVNVNAAERMRITSTGQMRLAGAGITFNGDTAAANELDDYEEGTWTPTVQFGGASVGITGTFSGTYTKTGNVVTLGYRLTFSSKGTSTGSMTITGLPFSASSVLDSTSGFGYMHRLASLQTAGQLYFQPESTTIYPRFTGYNGGNTTSLADTDIGNDTDLRGGIVYRV